MTQPTETIRLTPLEKLISDKQRLSGECHIREEKLSEDFSYIQEHVGSLLLSGVSSLLFPSAKSHTKKEDSSHKPVSTASSGLSLGMSDYLSMAKGLLPMAWDIAQPMLLSWGIKKAKNWVSHLLFRKKK